MDDAAEAAALISSPIAVMATLAGIAAFFGPRSRRRSGSRHRFANAVEVTVAV